MIRKGELYTKQDITITPLMIDANVFVDIEYNGIEITLNKKEFDCLQFDYTRVKNHYDFLKLLVLDDTDEIDIPFPSHIYANNVLELSSECFFYASYHNNKLMICLRKDKKIIILPETIFDIEFNVISYMLDQLMVSFVANWCVYCLNHRSLKKCIVCAN